MKFYSSSDRAGIVDDIFFLVFGDSSDHSSDYSLADITRNVNRWYDRVVTKILQADNRLEWDDTNKTDLPIARINLVANQQDYGVTAATFLKLHKVDAYDANGNPIPLKQITLDDLRGIADADFESTAGTPRYYRLQGSSIFLYPKPSYSYTQGLRIFYQRNVDYFASTDTTKTPGFAEPFHRILSLGAAYDYAMITGMRDKIQMFRNEIQIIQQDLIDFYSSRNEDKISLSVEHEDYGQSALTSFSDVSPSPDRFDIP
jgi:hypothetical protein